MDQVTAANYQDVMTMVLAIAFEMKAFAFLQLKKATIGRV